ncbi:MAG: dethiobiotin synthase, partial [Neisseriaceae bacterium]|nr:dethiobiotin synthase [Neisseriaceae bacterium]
MMNFFITATNTDVGKTFITCSLLKAFLNKNISTLAIKPVQTGCFWQNGIFIAPDVEEYKKVNPKNDIAPKYAFEYPASPHFSAKLENKNIQSSEIIDYIQQCNQENTISLIEGAGGIFVPLNKKETFLDIMKQCQYPIILVCKNELGCLNTTLLSIEILQN